MVWMWLCSILVLIPAVSGSVYIETNGRRNWNESEKLSHYNISIIGHSVLFFRLKTCQTAILKIHPLVVGERSVKFRFENWDEAGKIYGTASVGTVSKTMGIADDYSETMNVSSSCNSQQTYWVYTYFGRVYIGTGCGGSLLWSNSKNETITIRDVGMASVGTAEWFFATSCDALNANLPNKTDGAASTTIGSNIHVTTELTANSKATTTHMAGPETTSIVTSASGNTSLPETKDGNEITTSTTAKTEKNEDRDLQSLFNLSGSTSEISSTFSVFLPASIFLLNAALAQI